MSSYQNFRPRGGQTGQIATPNVFGVPTSAQPMEAPVRQYAAMPGQAPMPGGPVPAPMPAPQGAPMGIPAGQGIPVNGPVPQGAQMSAAGAQAGQDYANRMQLSPEVLAALRAVAMRGVPVSGLPAQASPMAQAASSGAFAGQQSRQPPPQVVSPSLADMYRTQGVPRR